jgi:ABC-type transport system involved in cytochrome c biogenesis permease subunit
MTAVVHILVIAVPLLYTAAVAAYGMAFFTEVRWAERVKTPVLGLTILCHALYLALRTAAFDHPPITSVFEIMTVLAASIAVGYLYIEVRTRASATGFFILLIALAFQTTSSIFISSPAIIPEYLHSLVLGFHVSAALMGYTALSLSAAYGFLYLMLYHEIKSSRFGLIYNRLPNLEMLETMSHKAEVFGFVTLGVAIGIGLLWLPRVFTQFSYWDPKLVGSLVIWSLYAAALGAKKRLGWQGRKTMIISLVAFCFVFLSMTVINLYLSEFHSFH